MNIFDIIGPVMVGPSSSHTAGACKIGYVSRKLLGEEVAKAEILLHGSFLATGKGHGTQYALAAGILGMKEDDPRIPQSFEIAKAKGISLTFGKANLKGYHPNSVKLHCRNVHRLVREHACDFGDVSRLVAVVHNQGRAFA